MSFKISIVTPSLNQGKYIRDSIESVLNQDYSDYEHIIIDGGSTDDTLNIINEYKHIKLISESDTGASNAINKGFKLSTGSIGAWINADDYYSPNIFKSVVNIFNNHPNTGVVYGRLTLIDEFKKIISEENYTDYNLEKLIHESSDSIRQPCTFFKIDLYNKVEGLNENLKLVFDYDLFLKLLKNQESFYYDKNLAFYRDHNNTLTRKNVRRQALEIFKVSRANGANLSDKIIRRILRKIFTGKL